MNILIKDHATGALEFISNPAGLALSDLVEAWQKKQTDYLLRGQLRACSYMGVTGGLIDAMRQSNRLI